MGVGAVVDDLAPTAVHTPKMQALVRHVEGERAGLSGQHRFCEVRPAGL
jgi:hypothetical protein